jgi:hypothetical protein
MAGTFKVDVPATFSAALLMASAPRMRFGTQDQDISASGERKWEIQAAVTYHAEYGMRAQSEVISITVPGGTDPAAAIPPGTPVEFENFRVGFSAPEKGANDRIRGGKPWFQASGLHAVAGARNGRQMAEAKSE